MIHYFMLSKFQNSEFSYVEFLHFMKNVCAVNILLLNLGSFVTL